MSQHQFQPGERGYAYCHVKRQSYRAEHDRGLTWIGQDSLLGFARRQRMAVRQSELRPAAQQLLR